MFPGALEIYQQTGCSRSKMIKMGLAFIAISGPESRFLYVLIFGHPVEIDVESFYYGTVSDCPVRNMQMIGGLHFRPLRTLDDPTCRDHLEQAHRRIALVLHINLIRNTKINQYHLRLLD